MGISEVKLEIDGLLKPMAFRRRGLVWNRRSENRIDVVDVQRSKSSDSFTINTGVLNIDILETFWEEKTPDFVDAPLCTVTARIGQLVDRKDIWWSLDDISSPDVARDSISTYVLPFIDRMHSADEMEKFLAGVEKGLKRYPPVAINLFILQARAGRKSDALATLQEIRKTAPEGWQSHIDKIWDRIDASPTDSYSQ